MSLRVKNYIMSSIFEHKSPAESVSQLHKANNMTHQFIQVIDWQQNVAEQRVCVCTAVVKEAETSFAELKLPQQLYRLSQRSR